jgi:hypothetical protein
MVQQQGNALTFYAFYVSTKLGKTSLTVTVDIYEVTTGTPIVSGGSATELGGGLYYYTLASGSVDANGAYIAVFKTSDTSVDQQHLPAIWQVGTTWVANLDATITSRLSPTTAGRTLDVSATGEAGIDLANVGSPTSTLNLSGTTIKTATDVETDTQDIQSRLPAVLVGGRIDASAGAVANGAITAAAIATDAIDADALAADAVTKIQSGLATSANQTTILNRLGTFTGSGVNTVLGFFQALLRKNASTPSDVGGTFAPSTDSVEALQEQITAEFDALSGTTLTVVNVVNGNTVTVHVGDTWEFTLTGLGSLAAYEAIAFIVKRSERDTDDNALLYLRSDVGLVRLNQEAATASDGSLTVGVGEVTPYVAMSATAGVTLAGGFKWWIKGLDTSATPDEGTTIATGVFTVNAPGVRAIV